MRRSEARAEKSERRSGKVTPIKKDAASTLKIPHDPVNEQVIIAAALVDQPTRKKLAAVLPSDSFFAKGHSEIWESIVELERRNLSYDPATIRSIAGEEVDTKYLDLLVEQRPVVPPNLVHHVEELRWGRARIEAARGPISSLLEAIRDTSADIERVRSLARQVAGAFDGFGSQRYLRDPMNVTRNAMTAIRARRGGQGCWPYGIPGLDNYGDGEDKAGEPRLMPGMAPAQVTCVTGISGGGKTTLTAAIALAQANARRVTLYGAWEQGSELTLELLAVLSLGLSRTRVTVGNISDEEDAMLEEEMDRLGEFIRFFELPFGRSKGEKQFNDRNLDTIHGYIADTGAEVFIADLWRRTLRQFDPDEEEAALYRQQAIAKETNCHCLLLHQQRLKDIENRADKRPTREGLKGSGAWVEVPDTILAPHRPALFKSVEDNVLEIIVLKQRSGPWPLAVEFDWDPDSGQILNGRGISYDRPGESGEVDSFLNEAATPRRGGGRTRSNGASRH